jgi:hydroxycarboxylate dehydrogenase B
VRSYGLFLAGVVLMPTFSAKQLMDLGTRLLSAGGLGDDEARLIANSLVGANLRGHDSHGVMRIPSYLDACRKGDVVAGAELTAIRNSPGIFVGDGHWGFGQTHAQRLTRMLIDMAREHGTATGTIVNCFHVGRLGEYCEMAAESGMVSMMMVNTHGHARRVAPPGGKAPRLGTNPLAIGSPAPDGPLVLDFGTSATAEGKVRVRRIAGQVCPDGWLLDSEGRPTNDPNSIYGNPPGTIRPMGGDQSYKGFGLGLMIEILTGALTGGVCIREVPINQLGNCVFMLVFDPDHLGGAEHFQREVAQLVEFIRSCPKIDPAGEIQLPGDPERRMLAQRTQHGIPLDDGNWAELVKLAERLSVALPS